MTFRENAAVLETYLHNIRNIEEVPPGPMELEALDAAIEVMKAAVENVEAKNRIQGRAPKQPFGCLGAHFCRCADLCAVLSCIQHSFDQNSISFGWVT